MMPSETMRCDACGRETMSRQDGLCDKCAPIGWRQRAREMAASADALGYARGVVDERERLAADRLARLAEINNEQIAHRLASADAAGYARGVEGAARVCAERASADRRRAGDIDALWSDEQSQEQRRADAAIVARLDTRADALAEVAAAIRALAPTVAEPHGWDLIDHLRRQRAFSERTFGPGPRTAGVLDHIRKELREIEAQPTDLAEWVDVIILALDGAWRAGHEPEAIVAAIEAKQTINEARVWPDWRTQSEGKAIEHERGGSVITVGMLEGKPLYRGRGLCDACTRFDYCQTRFASIVACEAFEAKKPAPKGER